MNSEQSEHLHTLSGRLSVQSSALTSCALLSVQASEPELTVLLYSEYGELVHLPLVGSGLAELE